MEEFLHDQIANSLKGEIQLILTSPPFPLNKRKAYGNLQGTEYLEWITSVVANTVEFLKPNGSLVIELGNAWVPRSPEMSTLPLETLLSIKEKTGFSLCQQFIIQNPARLPSPVQWVNVERIRVKDTFTHAWWLAPTPRPHADNRNVLIEYSESMKTLLAKQHYNAGNRPSGHRIGSKSFLSNNGGAIPSNVLTASNTTSMGKYQQVCRQNNLPIHPARMQPEVVEFFVNFLTEPNDLVLDPFGGSNTTGYVAESLARNWISIETDFDYIRGSTARFDSVQWNLSPEEIGQDTILT
ncbi:DNA-methyltransferase [Candidatus Poriferisocius sp.]|uniref:DNA-methyltransferase n=1 Tax=Candidatus Poriferisocius sp. TaxID=3101276 RepID=UPI003B02460B